MKKFFMLLVFFAVLSTAAVQAQNYKPFRVGLGIGYASPAGDGAKGGVLAYLEPSYRITDAIAVGLKAEAAIMFRGTTITQNGQSYAGSGSVSGAGSYTLNGQYYFPTAGGFRPYAGAGFGIYSIASASVSFSGTGNTQTSSQSETVAAGSKFGFYPRVGFDAGHFTLNIEYNIVGKSTNSIQVNSNGSISTATTETKNNYLGFRLGFFIGGGKKA
jgi:outer membrane protein W